MVMTRHRGARHSAESGSVLILAVLAMLSLGVLGVSLALLARIEAEGGASFRQGAQAEALAEGALAYAVDVVRPSVLAAGSFTGWLGAVVVDGVPLAGGEYSARVDDDCAPVVPAPLEQVGCPSVTDANGTAVVTAWARAGVGRARVRAHAVLDQPWTHVCASSRGDAAGYCGEAGGPSGAPVLTPADPGDPHGPAAYEALPIPVLGCSRIDPSLHGAPSGCPAGSRLVLTGEDPSIVPGAAICQEDPGGGRYFGYFDCALQTPCESPTACPTGTTRGCVRPGDSRLVTQPSRYREPGPGGCVSPHPDSVTGDPSPATGMVLNYAAGPLAGRNPRLAGLGAPGRGVTVYVLRQGGDGQVEVRNGTVRGTLVVEGNGVPAGGDGCSSANVDVRVGDDALLSAEPGAYGYPLALVLYDPVQAAPTVTPPAPQSVCASLGTTNTALQGAVYSAGQVRLGAVAMDGTVVAFQVRSEGTGGRLSYNPASTAGPTPPPGFRGSPAARVITVWKTFAVCPSYREDRDAPSACG